MKSIFFINRLVLLVIVPLLIGITPKKGNCQLSEKDSLVIAELKNLIIEDTSSFNLYSEKLFTASFTDEYPETYKLLLEKGLEAGIKFSEYAKTAQYHKYLSRVSATTSDFDESVKQLELAIDLYAKLGDSTRMVNLFTELGASYGYKGDQLKSLKYLFEALNYYEANDNPIAAYTLNNIAYIYLMLQEYEKGRKYANRSISMAKRLKSPKKEYLITNAYYYLLEFDTESDSIPFYQDQALKYVTTIDTLSLIYAGVAANLYIVLAENAIDQMQLAAAKLYLDRIKRINDPFQHTKYHSLRLKYHLAKNDIASADKAVKDLIENQYKQPYDSESLRDQIDYFLLKGNFKVAKQKIADLLYLAEVSFKEDQIRYATYANAKYETDKEKAKNIALRKLQETQQKHFYIVLAFLSIVLLLLLLTSYLYRKNKKDKDLILKQSAELREANESKTRFFTNAAHELRTPIALITEPLRKTIEHSDLSLEEQNDLQIALRNSLSLKKRINQVLNLLKSERKELPLKFHSFLQNDFIKFIQQEHEYFSQQKGVELLIQTTPTDIILRTDVEKLLTIVANLIENAIKFTPDGKTVEVLFLKNEKNLLINIIDTGIGVSEKNLPNIFNRYFQIHDNNLDDGNPGLGIGLAICKEYIHLLGGTIHVESNLGEGTNFQLTVPITHSAIDDTFENQYIFDTILPITTPDSTPDKEILISNKNTSKKNLLVVEDNKDMQSILNSILKQDYSLQFADNGADALEVLSNPISPSFDLMIIDLMMPNMNGFLFIEALKKDEKYSSIPLVILSALSKELSKLKMLRFSIDDYIMKPFDKTSLLARLDYLFNFQEQRRISKLKEANNLSTFDDTLHIDTEGSNTFLFDLENFVEQNLNDFDFSLDNLTTKFGVSNSTLTRKTKSLLGLTPKKYITELRYIKARELIINGDYNSVKSVCYSVGLKDLKKFSREFKKRFGKSPSDYL